MSQNPYRILPAVHHLLADQHFQSLVAGYEPELVAASLRGVLDGLRERIRAGESLDGADSIDALGKATQQHLASQAAPRLRRVINATGILLHTNLGRAPMAVAAAQAACDAAHGYVNLEIDLASGQRANRQDVVRVLFMQLTGAASATVVNNNAAATVIALRALASGKEVIVSRSELVEIGGSFRLPEIMTVSGARLIEVGSTNITRIDDYARAVTEQTALILRVHASNFRIIGHTDAPALEQLVALGKAKGIPVVDDIGSGALIDLSRWGFRDEPLARRSIEQGADLVLFSGDKLLGGPQAGILVGRADLIKRIEKDPFMRAVRLDKMALAALEATLRLYRTETTALNTIPLLTMLELSMDQLRLKASDLVNAIKASAINGLSVEVQEDVAYLGGGSTPMHEMPSVVCAVRSVKMGCQTLAQKLRLGQPAVLPRVQKDWVLFDVRTIHSNEIIEVARAVERVLQAC